MSAADAAAEIGDDAVARITAGTGSISGTITKLIDYQADVPLSGATVTAHTYDGPTDVRPSPALATTTSGADGSYTLTGLSTGSYVVLVKHFASGSQLLPDFYPNAAYASQAAAVQVTDGQDTPSIDELLAPLLSGYVAGVSRYEHLRSRHRGRVPRECRLRLHRLRRELPRRTERRPRRRDLRRAAAARRAERGACGDRRLTRPPEPVEHPHRRRYRRGLERGADEGVAARPGCGRLAARRCRPLRDLARDRRQSVRNVRVRLDRDRRELPRCAVGEQCRGGLRRARPDRSWHREVAGPRRPWPRSPHATLRPSRSPAIRRGLDGDREPTLEPVWARSACRAPTATAPRSPSTRSPGTCRTATPRRCTPS